MFSTLWHYKLNASKNLKRQGSSEKNTLEEEEEEEEEEGEKCKMDADNGFRVLDEKTMIQYIKATPVLMAKLGNQLEGLKIKEIGDGNINFVYTVVGVDGSFVVKQAPPYMRSLGESYPMSPERAYFEALSLKEHGRLCPNHVPEVYHFDRTMSLTAMRYIEPPHIVLRKGLIAGIEYPLLAEHMSEYLARTLYFTSLLSHSTPEHKRSVAEFIGNVEACMVSEQYFFSEAYKDSPRYIGWKNSPYLDNDAKALRQDDNLKLEIAKLKSMFCERSQALIHGDLHTGSVMVTTGSTQVIDTEFAFYGPIGYDIGSFVAHLIIAFFAQDGLANQENDREEYKQWILRIIQETWNLFEKKFVSLWNEHKDGDGEAYLSTVYNTPELQILVQKNYMKDLFHDSLGFGAAKLIWGTMTVSSIEDFDSITNASKRACCQRHALNLGKLLLKERCRFASIDQVIAVIQDISSI